MISNILNALHSLVRLTMLLKYRRQNKFICYYFAGLDDYNILFYL